MGLHADWQKYKKSFIAQTGKDFQFKKGNFGPNLEKVDTALEGVNKARFQRKKGLNDQAHVATMKQTALVYIKKAQDTGKDYRAALATGLKAAKKERKEAEKVAQDNRKDREKKELAKEKDAYEKAVKELSGKTDQILITLKTNFAESSLRNDQQGPKKEGSGRKSVMGYAHKFGPDLNKIINGIDKKNNIIKKIPGDVFMYIKYEFKDKDRDQSNQVRIIQLIAERRNLGKQDKLINEFKTIYGEFWANHIDSKTNPPTWLKPKNSGDAIKALNADVFKAMQETNKDIKGVFDDILKKKAKGRAHRSQTKMMAVKHAAMPALSAVGAGLSVLATIGTLGLALPIAAIAIHKSAVDIKKAGEFAGGRYRSTQKIKQAIRKNVEALIERSKELVDAEEELAKWVRVEDKEKWWDELSNTDPDEWDDFNDADVAKKQQESQKKVKEIKSKMAKKEIKAAAAVKFFSIRKKSITELEHLLDKYEKKIAEHYNDLYLLGKGMDKHNNKIKKFQIKIQQFEDKKKKVSKTKEIEQIDKGIKKIKSELETHKAALTENKTEVFEQVDDLMLQEEYIQEWAKQAKMFKNQRPDSVKVAKDGMNCVLFGEDLLAIILGGAAGGKGNVDKQAKAVQKLFAGPDWLGKTQAAWDGTKTLVPHLEKLRKKES